MHNFNFYMPTKIYFGSKQEENLAQILKEMRVKNLLLHYGGSSIKKSGLYDKIVNILQRSKISFSELSGVVPNPRLALVNQGIQICIKNKCDFILAVGGGSVIDSAKAIAAGVFYDGDVWDLFEGKEIEHKVLPVGSILTIPAAGSETSDSAVITKEHGGLKRSFGSKKTRPVFAIMNPELCYTLPKNQIANGISDILAHLMERYFTPTKNVELTDGLLESVMRTVIKFAPIVYENPTDYNAWSQIMWAGSIAHSGVLDCGRLGDWASHDIEHELSALYDVAHGAGLAVIFPAWMKYVYKNDVKRFERFAKEIFGATVSGELASAMGIAKLIEFYKSINLPVTAAELGANESDFAYMAQNAAGDGHIGRFAKLDKNDIEQIFKLTV